MAGATPLGNMVIKLGLDDADFGRGVANSKKQVTYLAKEMQANMKIADMAGNQLGKLGTRYDSLTQIIKAQENQVSSLKKAYDESFVDGKATDSTKRLAAQLQDANGKLANYKSQLNNTAGQLARLKVETQGVTGWMNKSADSYIKQGEAIAKVGDNISKLGTGLTIGVTAPILAGVTAVTKAAVSWESAFAGVKKTNDEVTNSNGQVVYSYADLETGLRNLSKELPSSHTEIAAVAEAAGQLGIKTQDVVSFTKVMLDMGESTNLSAEDAATAIAKIANITGLTSDEYQRFGSSVVALGNNFATTESDIVEMSNRLASAGTLAGLTNQEILGLATAMSSVGIEAEAGGTAMTQTLTAIETAATKGGESLDKFASIAGMSSEQFATTWKNKPIEAIQAFIKGLGDLDSQGESATLVLDEMGLSGVRQSNMLKSLALASNTMTSAVDMSNKAWSENTALTKEANTRYETTESKLKMLKNEINDAAIDLGGPFVDALRNGLTAIKPTIEDLGELAKRFNELDTEQQQNIIKWIAIAAAAGPTLKLLGGGISIIGNTRKGIGLLSKSLVELAAKAAEKKAIAGATTAVTSLGTASATAGGASGVGALAAGLGAIAGPAAIAIGAVAAVGIAAYAGVKAYEAHQLAGAKWGTEVTKEQDKVIEKSYELREKAVGYVNEYADGVKGSADKAIKANNAIVDSIQSTIDKEYERQTKNAEKVEKKDIRDSLKQQAENDKKYGEQLVEQAKIRVDRINTILTNASNNNRELSDAERKYISANYKQLSDEQLKAAGFNSAQRIAIESAYQDKLSNLTTKQLQDRASKVDDALSKEQKSYEEQRQAIIEGTKNSTERQKALLAELDAEHKKTNESMILGLAKLTLAQGFSLDQMSGAWEQYGWTTEEVASLVNASNNTTTENLDMMAKATNEAGIAWNQLALDPKTGEVKTNMADTLVEIAKTDEGWSKLSFMAKNADISTNAKEEIAIAMGEAGKWETMYLTDKKLLVNGDEAQLALYDTIDKLGMWNQYNADRKTLGVNNADAIYELMAAQGKLQEWNGLAPELKTLLATDPAKMTIENTKSALDQYNALPPALKKLVGDNSSLISNVDAAKQRLVNYQLYNPDPKKLSVTADTSGATIAQQAINSVQGKSVVVEVEYRGRKTGAGALANATGTNYHPGGDMIVNDQKGPMYKELVKFPGQEAFIPQGRNVYIPDAPVGTKVVKASLTKMMMKRLGIPRYAEGVGIPRDSELVKNLESVGNSTNTKTIVNVNNDATDKKLDQLIAIMSRFSNALNDIELKINEDVFGKLVNQSTTKNYNQSMDKYGRRVIR